jgi:hypothetical protein
MYKDVRILLEMRKGNMLTTAHEQAAVGGGVK